MHWMTNGFVMKAPSGENQSFKTTKIFRLLTRGQRGTNEQTNPRYACLQSVLQIRHTLPTFRLLYLNIHLVRPYL